MKFCPNCGKTIELIHIESEGMIPYCKACDKVYFPHNPACIIALIEINHQLLLIKQDYLGDKYCLVAGHIKAKASVEETLKEEIKEEVNLDINIYHYLGSFYHEKSDNLMLGFYVKCNGNIALNNEVDAYKLMDKEEAAIALKDRSAGSYFLNIAKARGLI